MSCHFFYFVRIYGNLKFKDFLYFVYSSHTRKRLHFLFTDILMHAQFSVYKEELGKSETPQKHSTYATHILLQPHQCIHIRIIALEHEEGIRRRKFVTHKTNDIKVIC